MANTNKRKRKEEPYFENSDLVVMPQDNGIQSSEIDLTDNPGEDQTYSLQQPIFLNQIPIIQNQQLVYQVEGVQNINNLNFTNGTTQQNFVYIVIPTTNENVQIESLPLDILKKDKPDGFRSASFEKSNSDAIKQELNGGIVSSEDHPESNANIDKFLHATPVDPLQLSQQGQVQHVQVQPIISEQKIQQNIYLAEPPVEFAAVTDAEETNNKTVRTHGYKCDYHPCPLAFSCIYEKKAHMDTHLFPENTEFKCNICNSVFSRAADRNKHVESHSVVNTYKCTNCKQDFPYYTSLVKHIDENRCVAKNKLHPCYFCGAKFVYHVDLERHHQNNLKVCVCNAKICGEQSFEVHINLCSVYKNKSSKCRKKNKTDTPVIVLD